MAGCRNALPAIVCHAILRVKYAVENQLLMVPLESALQAAGTWGSFSNYVTLWGGGSAMCYTLLHGGEAMPVLRNRPVVRQFLALHAFHTRAMLAPQAPVCFVHHF